MFDRPLYILYVRSLKETLAFALLTLIIFHKFLPSTSADAETPFLLPMDRLHISVEDQDITISLDFINK